MANPRHILFIVSILLKGIFAVLETVAGFAIYISPPDYLRQVIHFMIHNRLVADPNDHFATIMLGLLQDFDVTRHTFVSVYLMLHGLVKVGVVGALLSEKLWAFPLGLTALGLFVAYQMERFFHSHAPLLVVVSIFDAFIMWLTWREYQAVKHREV